MAVILCSVNKISAQKDSIAQRRKARKLVRNGNALYEKQQFTDASVGATSWFWDFGDNNTSTQQNLTWA